VIAGVVAFVALLPLASLRLQGQGSGLSGVVYDPSRAVVPRAAVTVVNNSTGATETLVSDLAGAYSFPALPTGDYQLTVRQPGFEAFVRKPVAVPGKLDAILSLGRVASAMTVSGRRSASAAPPPRSTAHPRRRKLAGRDGPPGVEAFLSGRSRVGRCRGDRHAARDHRKGWQYPGIVRTLDA